VLTLAAEGGHTELLRWLLPESTRDERGRVTAHAAAAGQLRMCQLLHAEGCEWNSSACDFAALGGNCEVLRWLREAGCPWNASDVRRTAAATGSVDTLAYLQQAGILSHAAQLTEALAIAGAYDRLHAAVWLRQQGAE
jgi:Ankyrin repeats (many copies)